MQVRAGGAAGVAAAGDLGAGSDEVAEQAREQAPEESVEDDD